MTLSLVAAAMGLIPSSTNSLWCSSPFQPMYLGPSPLMRENHLPLSIIFHFIIAFILSRDDFTSSVAKTENQRLTVWWASKNLNERFKLWVRLN